MATVKSEMVGNISQVVVSVGDSVSAGDPLLFVESMKMEIPVEADGAGTVAKIHVEAGASVQTGDALVDLS